MAEQHPQLLDRLLSQDQAGGARAHSRRASRGLAAPRTARLASAVGLLAVLVGASIAPAQVDASDEPIDLRTIMQHPDWLGRAPQDPYWGSDGATLYFERSAPVRTVDGNQFDPRIDELYRIDGTQTGRSPLGDDDLAPIPPSERGDVEPQSRVVDPTTGRVLYVRDGDLYLHDPANGDRRQLTRTVADESAPIFFVDGRIGYQVEHAVYAIDLDSGLHEQLFDVRGGESPQAELEREQREAEHLAREQGRFFDWVRDEQAREAAEIERRRRELAEDPSRSLPPLYLGKDLRPQRIVASPNGRHALVVAGPAKPSRPRQDKMPAYVTESGFVEVRDVRSKVGDSGRTASAFFLIDRTSATVRRLDLGSLPGITDDPLAELREAAKRREQERQRALGGDPRENGSESSESEGSGSSKTQRDEGSERSDARAEEATLEERATELGTHDDSRGSEAEDDAAGDDVDANGEVDDAPDDAEAKPAVRPVSVAQVLWNRTGTRAVFQAFSHDNKDRWIALVQPMTLGADASPKGAELVTLLHDHDPAWINWRYRDLLWLPDGRHLLTLSERSGYSHLYRLDARVATDSGAQAPLQLTAGDFVVDSIQVASDSDPRFVYFVANQRHPGNFEVHRVAIDAPRGAATEAIERVTDLGGLNTFSLSPDGERLALLHSRSFQPPELYVQPTEPGATATQLTSLVSEEFEALPWVDPEIVAVPSSHQERPIYSRLFLPESTSPSPKRPAVLFIHGAGYLQNAHMGWSSYFRETMFSTLLTQLGYVVLDMDYRGSAGYGRDWRTAIYRNMGTPEVEDLVDGACYLVENHDVDPERIGMWGGSYGGFLTFMALFKEPEVFAAGAALRPVTDWAHYNHPYTSNILNTPELDPEAYGRSSPIEFAEGLEDPLLIAAGMLDDNVFFQDSVRLVQRLIELEKQDWELAVYPVEPHGFREPSSWLDEYRRILKLFEQHVRGRGAEETP